MPPTQFGPRTVPHLVRELREAAGLTQDEFAYRIGVTTEWYARVENPRTGVHVSVDLLDRILDRLDWRLTLVMTPVGVRRHMVRP